MKDWKEFAAKKAQEADICERIAGVVVGPLGFEPRIACAPGRYPILGQPEKP